MLVDQPEVRTFERSLDATGNRRSWCAATAAAPTSHQASSGAAIAAVASASPKGTGQPREPRRRRSRSNCDRTTGVGLERARSLESCRAREIDYRQKLSPRSQSRSPRLEYSSEVTFRFCWLLSHARQRPEASPGPRAPRRRDRRYHRGSRLRIAAPAGHRCSSTDAPG